MKKILSALVLLTLGYCAFPQSLKSSASSNPEISPAVMVSETTDNTPAFPTANVNARALKNFKKSFKNAAGASWYEMQDGYRVKFTANGSHSDIFY